jgi:hypothetical protein
MSSKAMRTIPTSVMPSKVSELVRNLVDDIDVLGKYHEDSDYIIGKDLSNKKQVEGGHPKMISLSIHTDFHGRLSRESQKSNLFVQLAVANQVYDFIESRKQDVRLLVVNNLTKFFKESNSVRSAYP